MGDTRLKAIQNELRNIYFNDRQNTIIETYNNITGKSIKNTLHNFLFIVLNDNKFLKILWEEKQY